MSLLACVATAKGWVHHFIADSMTDHRFVYPDQEFDFEEIDWVAYHAKSQRISQGGDHYEPLQAFVDLPGVVQPELIPADQTGADAGMEVIGFHIDGQAYAFCIDPMFSIDRHVINFQHERRPIAVSYCDRSDCARVLTSDRDTVSPLGIGGLDIKNELVLLLDGERYSQRSQALPMADVSFQRMSLGEWRAEFPDTLVYVGDRVSTPEIRS